MKHGISEEKETRVAIDAPDFDLRLTLNSGQVFHWLECGDGFVGCIGDEAVYVEQRGPGLRAKVASASSRWTSQHGQDAHATIRSYFALDHPLTEICRSFPRDPFMRAAKKSCRGLRIIRQPLWECLATFITSSMKQVAHIRQISLQLREEFGERRTLGNIVAHSYPSADRIAALNEERLRGCRLGYRAKNLLATARLIAEGTAPLEDWRTLNDEELRGQLLSLPGVGPKIANCVMLFAYERRSAFPIDVWVERTLRAVYFARRRKITASKLRDFAADYFGPHGGYAQQYLFHHARTAARRAVTG